MEPQAGIASTLLRTEFINEAGIVGISSAETQNSVALKIQPLRCQDLLLLVGFRCTATAVQRTTAVSRIRRVALASWPASQLLPCSLHNAS